MRPCRRGRRRGCGGPRDSRARAEGPPKSLHPAPRLRSGSAPPRRLSTPGATRPSAEASRKAAASCSGSGWVPPCDEVIDVAGMLTGVRQRPHGGIQDGRQRARRAEPRREGEGTHTHHNNQSAQNTPLTRLGAFPEVREASQAGPRSPFFVHARQDIDEPAHWTPPSTMLGLERPPATRESAITVRGPMTPSSWSPPTARWKRRTACWKRPS